MVWINIFYFNDIQNNYIDDFLKRQIRNSELYDYLQSVIYPLSVKRIEIYGYNDYIIEGLERFNNLKELKIVDCENLIQLPDFPKLTELIIENCNDLNDISYNVLNLKKLQIKKNSGIKLLPETLYNLEELKLEHCNNIQRLPINLENLQSLIIEFCFSLTYLSRNLHNLQNMTIKHCKNLKYLSNDIFNLKYLELIDVGISYLPELVNIKIINFMDLYNLINLPDTMFNLKYLELTCCKNLKQIPTTLINAEKIILRHCDKKIDTSIYRNTKTSIIIY